MTLMDGRKAASLDAGNGTDGTEEKTKRKRGRPPKAKTEKAAKPKKAKAPKKVKEEVAKAKRAASRASDPDAARAAKSVVKRFEDWQRSTGNLHDVTVKMREKVGGAEASFRDAVTESLPIEHNAEAIERKLRRVEVGWQSWQDAQLEATVERNAAKDQRRKAWKSLERAIEETRQLPLFQD